MFAIGSKFFAFEPTRRNCNAPEFTSDLGIENNIPIVNGDLACDCPSKGKVCILVIRNLPYDSSMDHNLMMHFIIRARGVTFNDILKIHCDYSIVDDQAVSFKHSYLRAPFQLNGAFSCFYTTVPVERELH